MLRDLKFFRRNMGKKPDIEEIENVPLKPTDTLGIQVGNNVMRPPLNTIQEPIQHSKYATDQELGTRTKIDRTPTKVQAKGANASSTLRTPEKQVGFSSRNKFGWIQKNEGNETRDEGKSDVNQLQSSTRGSGLVNGGLTNMTPRSVRSVGRTVTNHSDCSSTQSTPTKSVTKPSNTGIVSLNNPRPPMSTGARLTNYAALTKGVPISYSSPSIVDAVEVPQFELKEDPSFWMDHNVQVLIRIRPLNNMERNSHGHSRCLKQESAQTITWIGQPETRFTFDHVACEAVNQEMLFRVAGLPMVENCLSGYNSCMFAFGQTGSGKTHTMLGEINELEVKPSPDRGMTPRIFEFLFARIRAEEESRRDEKLKYNCKCSFLEIYNEQITDLLDPLSTNLLLREDIKKGVYVENLTEYEVQSVNDILKLLTEGAANRKVAATNMNRESSRSHSVFTCVIESRSEKDSTTNLRFARLNLVDLAGSERQKTSGAEGERLKEAANINKSLSTLGHVIMLLVDVAQGKLRHIPYRDSRLTFLLQESLGGNSKTMIIANVSPSICCAAETLSTLKFAQRAKLIQNNAVINEDASGDVTALQHQIQMLKEELSIYKRRNVSRSLSFHSTSLEDTDGEGTEDSPKEMAVTAQDSAIDTCQRSASSGTVRVSSKQLKSLEATLAGAFRREQMAESSIKQLEAEIAQLNRLVNQREEDTRCTKMMLKFREDKIQRMESLHVGSILADAYLQEENNALSEEIQLLRAKIDRNPEVTRFALENIRLLDKLRSFQEFHEEGEREMLLAEVSELRNQLLQYIDGNTEQYNHLTANMPYELKKTTEELEQCRNNLSSCLEINTKLTREINDLHCQLDILKSSHQAQDTNIESTMDSMEVQALQMHMHEADHDGKANPKREFIVEYAEDIMNLQLELDIFKVILQEERSSRNEVVEKALSLSTDLEMERARCSEVSIHCDDLEEKLKDSRSLIEALESQQILLINELEGVRDNNNHFLELLGKQEEEASVLRDQIHYRNLSPSDQSGSRDSSLQIKLKRMQDSLEKAKKLNTCYQNDQAFQTSHEQEMDEVRRQAEAETAEVIICLQEELITLQQEVNDCKGKEIETKENMLLSENKMKELKETLCLMDQDNKRLNELVQEKEDEIKTLSEKWEALACDIKEAIIDGHEALEDATDEVKLIASFVPPRNKILEQVGNLLRDISEKELIIEELQRSLEEANSIKTDMDWKLRSLKGAALAITEVQQQESTEKEKEILKLTSLLSEKSSFVTELRKERDDQFTRAETCATVAFVIMNRLSEIASDYRDVLKQKDSEISEAMSMNMKKDALHADQVAANDAAEKKIQILSRELEVSVESCIMLKQKLSEEEDKLLKLEKSTEEAKFSWVQKEEVFDLELNDAKVVATQKAAECASLLAKLEEAQETMKEADVVINRLVTANGILKLEMERLKEKTVNLTNEKDFLINEVDCLQLSNDHKDQLYASLERQYLSDLSDTRGLVQTMVDIIPEVQFAFNEQFESILDNVNCFKSQILDLTWSWLEDIWSEIIVKDCAVSVLHLCHMGVLLEAVNGLNAENGLLHHGLCESNSVMMDLKEQNFKATKELEMFGIVKGKLHVDIKNSFDRILRKEDEARKLGTKLNAFEKKILDLQLQEELMLARSKSMGSELSLLTEELDQHNANAAAVLSDQVKFMRDKDKLTSSQAELLTIDLASKDFESLILASELVQMSLRKADLEGKQETCIAFLEDIKKEIIFLQVDAALGNQLFMDLEVENSLLKKVVEETDVDRNGLLQSLKQCHVRLLEMEQEKEALEQACLEKADLERKQETLASLFEDIQKELIFLNMDAALENQLLMETESENSLLKEAVEETDVERNDLAQSLKQCHARVLEVEQEKETLEQSLKFVASSNDKLQSELVELMETKERLTSRIQLLETETAVHVKDSVFKETALQASICELETKLDQKDAELNKLCSIELENETLKNEVQKLQVNCDRVFSDLQEKHSVFEASSSRMHELDQENQRLQEQVCSLEDCISILQYDQDMRIRELDNLRHSQSCMEEKLSAMMNDLEIQTDLLSSSREENKSLRSNHLLDKQYNEALLSSVSTHVKSTGDMVKAVDGTWERIFQMLDGELITLLENMFREICENKERACGFIKECECLESFIEELTSENLSFQAELLRKDDILKGLLFDLSLLQESAYNAKGQKDEIEEMVATVKSLEDELTLKSAEHKETVIQYQILEAQVQEKINLICDLELDLSNKSESLKLVMDENIDLKSRLEDVSLVKGSIEDELNEKTRVLERLEEEKFQMDNALGQMNAFLECLRKDLNGITCERDLLQYEVCALKEKLETAQTIAEENEARAVEALQTADSTKAYADDKEEEVKLLERSVEELESTVDALENKVDIVKGEAERQRLLREELETELQLIRSQISTVATPDTSFDLEAKNILCRNAELQRHLEEKDRVLQETQGQVEVLEKNIADKDAEISQCRAHICELNLHAEAQAQEYKQKFKALEAMAEEVKPDPVPSHTTNSSSTKLEKNAAKSRGSGSPFKCIGLGLTQQINSEKDEELTAGRHRIEELESLAASRQKEIFMLNTRLAAAQSMTHDVIRDLLGVKLDMNNYASLLDHQQVHEIGGKAQVASEDLLQEQQVIMKLKQQLNEFAEERQGWLEEINRKQAEVMSAQIASEKLRQRDQFLTTENDMLKKENVSHKKKVMELEDEVKKLSGQQNLQQRIHHHAKIKEENNLLKTQNEDLSIKLRRMEMILSRLKEELTRYRASNGRNPSIDLDEEQQLRNRLKGLEEEKLQLTQELLSLCTNILKAAGITRPAADVSLSKAEAALERLKNRIVSLERETQDLTLKNKLCKEKVRLLELKQQPSPLNSRTNENRTATPERAFQTPFFSCLDR